MSFPAARGSGAQRAACAYATAALVLLLTRHAPGFTALGPRGALLGWLAFVTAVTAGLPALVMAGWLRQPLSASGLSWGRTRRDAAWLVAATVGAVALAAVVSRSPEMRAFYPRYAAVKSEPLLWLPSTLGFALYGLSWEMLFRGHLLLGALPTLGRAALLLQAVPFALAHVDKPPLEAWLSLPAGLVLGLVALRTRSVLPGVFVHFALSLAVNLFCAYGGP